VSYAGDMLQVMDDVARATASPGRMIGTVSERDAAGSRVVVVFDGDAVAVPVKCFANVDAYPGDRVGLVLFGSDWVVVGSFTRHGPSTESVNVTLASANTSSASYVDMDGGHPFTWRKQYDDTRVRLRLITGGFSNTAGNEVSTAMNVSGGTGDVFIAKNIYTLVSHEYHGGFADIALPAGFYTITARWKMSAGSGGVSCNASDVLSMSAEEIAATQVGDGHTTPT